MKKYSTRSPNNIIWKTSRLVLIIYFSVSILLSVFIFLRLQVTPSEFVKLSNVTCYFLYYYIIPSSIIPLIIYFSWFFFESKGKTRSALLMFFCSLAVMSYFFMMVFSLADVIPGGLLLPVIPAILMALFYLTTRGSERKLTRIKVASSLALVLSVSIVTPHITAFLCYHNILNEAKSIGNKADRTRLISDYVRNTVAVNVPLLKDCLRAEGDFWKFLLVGVGACGEIAMATSAFLDQVGIEARKVCLPGEDHAFVEVRLNDTWWVVDPGYYRSEILTRQQRAIRRIDEFGAISYVIAYSDSSFVELTQYYVSFDTIIIRVTYRGEPLANAKICLIHKFLGRNMRLPDSVSFFYSDGNGTVVLHIGALNYKDKADPYEPYYRIYINNQETGFTVNSTGTGKTNIVEIDLANLD